MKNFINIFFIVITSMLSYAQTPNWQWAKSAAGAGAENGNCVATDLNGNVFVSGYFYSPTITFGTFTLTNVGNYDLFIVKYDPSGNVLWAKSGGGAFDDVGLGVATDVTGNVYVTGYFYSPVFTLGTYTLVNGGVGDIFIVKYDGGGNELWAKNFGGSGDDSGNGISVNSSGNVFITGSFKSSSVAFNSFTLTNTGSDEVFVAKFDGLGNTIWAKSIEGSSVDVGNSIVSDNSGNVFVTGFFNSSSIVLDTYTLTNSGGSDVFIAKYDGTGNALWAESSGGIYNDKGYALAVDANGNVFLTGTFFSPTITISNFTLTNNGNFDFFVAKYNGFGTAIWAKGEGALSDDTGYGIVTDINGDVYVTGHFHSPSITFGTYTLSNTGIGDLYVEKYDTNGNSIWAQSAGGTSDDGASGIAIDQAGNIFVAGYFISPTISFASSTLVNTGTEDMFVAKIGNIITGKEGELMSSENDIVVYPNPSNGEFNILCKNIKIDGVEVFNQFGVKIYQSFQNQVNQIHVDLKEQVSGIYFVKVKSGIDFISKKIIVL